jgi:hypothetical protein
MRSLWAKLDKYNSSQYPLNCKKGNYVNVTRTRQQICDI